MSGKVYRDMAQRFQDSRYDSGATVHMQFDDVFTCKATDRVVSLPLMNGAASLEHIVPSRMNEAEHERIIQVFLRLGVEQLACLGPTEIYDQLSQSTSCNR